MVTSNSTGEVVAQSTHADVIRRSLGQTAFGIEMLSVLAPPLIPQVGWCCATEPSWREQRSASVST
jgi:hypothetical protein